MLASVAVPKSLEELMVTRRQRELASAPKRSLSDQVVASSRDRCWRESEGRVQEQR